MRELVRELRSSWRDLDPTVLSPRIAAVVYLVAGVLAIFVTYATPMLHASKPIPAIGASAAIFGAIALALPWQRWPIRAQLVFALFAFMLFAAGGTLASDPIGPYLAALPLPFVFVGFTQRPGTSIALTPVAAFALITAARFSFDQTLVAVLIFALPMLVLVGEAIALAEVQRGRSERRVDRLLHAVRVLARVDDERTGAQLVAALAAELLGAQAVCVLLSDRPGRRRYLNRAFFGHPALADAAPLLIESLPEVPSTTTQFVQMKRPDAIRAAAIVPLIGPAQGPLGVAIALWGSPRRSLHAPARQAAELLSQEAGRMFERLQTAAALTHDAETDPLTQLANRRTFARALQTLQPGDAIMIVDLDHFKNVNDTYGHQVGDETLRALAACLRDTARQVDTVARWGGEEFAVVLPGAGAPGAAAMLARLRRAWSARHPITTFSSGVAVHEEDASARITVGRADAALYEAKEAGRNRDVLAPAGEVVLP